MRVSLARLAGAAVITAVAACSRPEPPGRGSPSSGAAGPREIAVRVPAGLRLARSLEALTVSIDPAMLATTHVTAGAGMVVGVETDTVIRPLGGADPPSRFAAPRRHALGPGTDFEAGAATWTEVADGIPEAGTRYAAEMEIVLFETDVPPRPGWDPHAGRFRALWTRTLRQAEE